MRASLSVVLCMAAAIALVGCASTPPPGPARLGLMLAPSALGASVSLQQQLRIERDGATEYLEAALEVDDERIGMIGLALGQRVLSLEFDGATLTSWRHALLPQQVRPEDVLEDIQLTYWPVDAIRAALPPGWRIEDEGMRRALWSDDALVMTIDYSATPRWDGMATLTSLRYRYRLFIQSVPMGQ